MKEIATSDLLYRGDLFLQVQSTGLSLRLSFEFQICIEKNTFPANPLQNPK